MYSANILAVLIAYFAGSSGYQCAFDALAPLIVSIKFARFCRNPHNFGIAQGITFCLIVLQIRFHLDSNYTVHPGTLGALAFRATVGQIPREIATETGVALAVGSTDDSEMGWIEAHRSGAVGDESQIVAEDDKAPPGLA